MNDPKCALELWVSGTSGDSEGQDISRYYGTVSLTKAGPGSRSQINTPSSHVLGGPQLWGRARKCWLRWLQDEAWDTTLVGVIPGTNKTLHFLCIDTETRGPLLLRRPICVSTNLCVISVCQPASNDTSSVCHQQLSPPPSVP